MIISHQHPAKLVTMQSERFGSFWITQRIPPAPMKVSTVVSVMDDFGNLAEVDFVALAASVAN